MGYYSSGSPRRSTIRDYSPMRREPPNRCSLLVRNLARDVRSEDLRRHAEQYGPVRDVYIPTDYYSREPRGIGFVEYTHPRDAEEGKYGLDRMVIYGREIQVVFAQRGRKRPEDFRRGGTSRRYGGGGYGRYSPPRRNIRRRSYSRSPVRRRRYSYSRSPSPKKQYRRSYSRSPTPRGKREDYSRSQSPRDKSYDSRDGKPNRNEERNHSRAEEEERYDREVVADKTRYKDEEERQHEREDKMRDRYNEEDEIQTDRYDQDRDEKMYNEDDKGDDPGEENGISPGDKDMM